MLRLYFADMARTYVQIIVLEAATIAALWLISRAFS